MKLIDNARESWKWFSMQAMTLAGALQGAWLYIPPDLKDNVPVNMVNIVTLALLVAGVVGRLVKQTDAAKS